jgi:hypothetical protein
VHREDQRLRALAGGSDLARRLDPGEARHRHVKDRQVDVVAARELDRLRPVAGLRHDL